MGWRRSAATTWTRQYEETRSGDVPEKAFDHVQGNFFFVETNFLPGRRFTDFEDLNRQALAWCQEVANARPKRALGTSHESAYGLEKPYLQALPLVWPPVYEVCERVVDLSGYVSLDANRYSIPERLVGQTVTVYKYPTRIEIHHRHGVVATHPRLIGQRDARSTDPAHHPTPARASRTPALEAQLRHDSPELEAYVRALKQRGHGRGLRALRRLLEIQRTYPREPFLAAVRQAAHYGLYDLGRLEKLILQQVAGNFLMDQRYGRVSTLITTNLEPTAWYELFANKALVDALLDRLQHRCITIRIDGPSLRTPEPHSPPPIKSDSKSARLPSAPST
jgi:hypothetical protein